MKQNSTQQKPESRNDSGTKGFMALIPYFRPYKKEVFYALLALMTTTLMVLFFGKAIKYLIDFGFVSHDRFWLNIMILLFFIAAAIMSIAGYYRSSLINSVCEKVIADIRKKIYEHVISVSAEFFEINQSGDVISRLTVDAINLYNFCSNSVSFCLRNGILFLGGVIFLFLTSFKLTYISLLLIAFAILPIVIMGKLVKNLSHKSQNAISALSSRIEESISGVRTIQAYLCEEKEIRNFRNFVDNALEASLIKIRTRSLMVAVVIAVAFGAISIVIWIGSLDVISGVISSGELSSFIFYAVIAATSLVGLSQIVAQFQSASASASRIFELLEVSSPVSEKLELQSLQDPNSIKISFKDVSFAYPGRKENLVLKMLNLDILPSQKVAIVGQSGSGKSTIFQLLLRFYDVSHGAISLNGCDIRNLSFSDLRQSFSYISQDCFIFSGTIFENIAYVDKSITENDVAAMIEANPALHFIKHLPDKMHTYVGEKGIKLSGGERQRIAIARAMIKNSPILLLDEATSALDNQNEHSITSSIAEFIEKKTVITITHRLSSVVDADKIFFIKDGMMLETGSHQELLSLNGNYRKMYEIEEGSF